MTPESLSVPAPASSVAMRDPRISPKGAKSLLRKVHQARGALAVWTCSVGASGPVGQIEAGPLQITAAAICKVIEDAEAEHGHSPLEGLQLMYARHCIGQIDLVLWNYLEEITLVAPKASALRATADMARDLLDQFLADHGPALKLRARRGVNHE